MELTSSYDDGDSRIFQAFENGDATLQDTAKALELDPAVLQTPGIRKAALKLFFSNANMTVDEVMKRTGDDDRASVISKLSFELWNLTRGFTQTSLVDERVLKTQSETNGIDFVKHATTVQESLKRFKPLYTPASKLLSALRRPDASSFIATSNDIREYVPTVLPLLPKAQIKRPTVEFELQQQLLLLSSPGLAAAYDAPAPPYQWAPWGAGSGLSEKDVARMFQ